MERRDLTALNEADLRLREKLDAFLPDRIFDAHAHLYRTEALPEGDGLFQLLGTRDIRRLDEDRKKLYGDRRFGALLLMMPSPRYRSEPGLRDRENAWLAS